MAILQVGTVVAQGRDPLRQCVVAGHHRAAIAQRAEVLGREETESRRVAERAGPAPVTQCAMRLRRVLDQQQPVLSGQHLQRRHVGQLAIQMHRHDRARARPDGRRHAGRVEVERHLVGFHRHRYQPVLADRQETGDEGIAGHDDLVAVGEGAELPVGTQHQRQRIEAVAHAHRVAHAAPAGELPLEGRQLVAEHVAARVDDARRRGFQLTGMARIDLAEVEERHLDRGGLGQRAFQQSVLHQSGHS